MIDYVYNRISASQLYGMKAITAFLVRNDLRLDAGVTDFVEVRLDGEIVACGGIDQNIIKCVAIDSDHRGEGLALRLMTELLDIAYNSGHSDLFLFTKPENIKLFLSCGFYPLVQYQDTIVLMENSSNRLQVYCEQLAKTRQIGKKIGSIVMNANPFTLGHQHLIKTAAENCDWLHVFLVKEDISYFKYADRLKLVMKGVAGIPNVILHEGSDYIISRASFPNYFLKNLDDAERGCTALDLKLFREHIAPALNINCRFVGTEPIDIVTGQYNKDMQYFLSEEESIAPKISVIVLPRIEKENHVISASRVRAALQIKDFDTIKKLVPQTTYDFLIENYS